MRWLAGVILALILPLSACGQTEIKEPPTQISDESFPELRKIEDSPQSLPPAPKILNEFDITAEKRPPLEKSPSQQRFDDYYEGVERLSARKAVSIRINNLDAVNDAMAELDPEHAENGGFRKPACYGDAVQGGLVICHFKGRYEVDGYKVNTIGPAGSTAFIGINRDAPNRQKVKVWPMDHGPLSKIPFTIEFDVASRNWDTSRIDGLPPSQVSTFTAAQLKRIRSSSARKKVGFSSRETNMGFRNGFISPIKEFRKTTNFGAQRILNGEPKKPHYGVDMAAPVGTPIYAPADGTVSLADDDLYFEGAMVLLDHGQGLISMYLHTDEILVEPGQRVTQGEQIATVGSKGRSTGPHLCWRLKWRNRNLDPELLTEWPQDG